MYGTSRGDAVGRSVSPRQYRLATIYTRLQHQSLYSIYSSYLMYRNITRSSLYFNYTIYIYISNLNKISRPVTNFANDNFQNLRYYKLLENCPMNWRKFNILFLEYNRNSTNFITIEIKSAVDRFRQPLSQWVSKNENKYSEET